MRERAKARAPKKCSAWFPNRPARGGESGAQPGPAPGGLRRGSAAAGGPHPCRDSRAGNRPRPRRAPRRLPPPSPREERGQEPAAPPWRLGGGQREAALSRHAPGPAGTACLSGKRPPSRRKRESDVTPIMPRTMGPPGPGPEPRLAGPGGTG